MPREVPQDLIELAENTQRAWELNPDNFPHILSITKITEGLIFHVLEDRQVAIVFHSWDDIAKKRNQLLGELLGKPAAA
jgi:hypothetical protein